MPTYDYKCLKCGNDFERFQAMTEAPLKRCPECKGKVRRLIGSGSGLIFKGKGFYATDYKKPAASPSEPAPEPSCAACPQACKKPKKKDS